MDGSETSITAARRKDVGIGAIWELFEATEYIVADASRWCRQYARRTAGLFWERSYRDLNDPEG